jgi:hypothetical protein
MSYPHLLEKQFGPTIVFAQHLQESYPQISYHCLSSCSILFFVVFKFVLQRIGLDQNTMSDESVKRWVISTLDTLEKV